MEKEDVLYIVMPAYNEEANIEKVVKEWYLSLADKSEKSRLVIADCGSCDNTHSILMKMKEEGYSKIEVLDNDNQFHGPKVIALYKYAIDNGANYIFQTDSDGQTNPKEFEAFWNDRKKYDGIFGNRTKRGDGKGRSFVEKVVCFLLKIFFRVSIPDANAPFRLMKASVVSKYINKMPSDYNLPNIMMTTYFVHFNESVQFREISFKPRQGGKNSINISRIISIGIKALKDFNSFKKEMF